MIKRFYLEITNACNLSCPFCTNAKGHDFLAFANIEKIIKQIKKHCDYIYLHVLGEPLLHPDFDKILELLDHYEMKLQLVTNGTLLAKYPDILKHHCLRKLSISLHSIKDLGIDSEYFSTIDKLIEDNNDTIIELRFYEYEDLSIDLKDYYKSLINRYGYQKAKMKNCLYLKDKTYILHNEFFNWPLITDPFISDNGYCLGGKDMIAILHNGDVTLCCLDPKGHNSFGNIFKTSLDEILQDEKYLHYLDNINNRKLTNDLCTRCSYRLRFDDSSN